jgi:hypothetical protein
VGGFGQSMLGKYLEFADEQFKKGDYAYALEYYQKAFEIDSNAIAIKWKLAETNRAYKDYAKAAKYYKEVFELEETKLFPSSLLWYAMMEKQCGHYSKAIELLKDAKKKYAKDKKGYLYVKSKQELESCLWAKNAVKDTLKLNAVELPEGLNTKNAEFGHMIFNGEMIYSSLRGDSTSANEEVYGTEYKHKLYRFSFIDSNATTTELSDLNSALNTGNGVFSKDRKRFYYSSCSTENDTNHCQIMVSYFLNGKWIKPEPLGELINEPGTSNTTPGIAYIDNEEWLLFSSDREDGEGGMDLYFAVMKNDGNQITKVKKLGRANSIDNEIAPWFDSITNRVYFSSTWWYGFGGYDVHYMELKNGAFSEPINAGLPINSPANDVYFFKEGDSTFVSSNRLGVLYAKNPTCCSDIFAYTIPIKKVDEPPVTKRETLAELSKRLPVTLYFHNDIPNPRSKETTTNVNYTDAYNDYIAMIPEYKKEYSKGLTGEKVSDAEEDIESFFTQYVEQGVKDLELFKSLLLEELEKGYKIRLSVRGFASPLAKTEYNVALTKRRIASLVNHLMVTENGSFAPYLKGTAPNGGKLEVVGVPFGEFTANQITSDNPNDVKNSVFSRAAAIERKIEIQSVSYMDTDSLFFKIDLAPTSLILGQVSASTPVKTKFKIYNTSGEELQIEKIEAADNLFRFNYSTGISPSSSSTVEVEQLSTLPMGIFSRQILIYFVGYPTPLKYMVLGETK